MSYCMKLFSMAFGKMRIGCNNVYISGFNNKEVYFNKFLIKRVYFG